MSPNSLLINHSYFCFRIVFLLLMPNPIHAVLATDHAELYNQNSEMQISLAENVLKNDLKLNGFEHVLDIGCGDGKLTKQIAQQLPLGQVIAVDQSDIMINYAKQNNAWENITYLLIDANQVDTIDMQFDVILMFSSFHWFNHPSQTLEKIATKLKNGGRIVILTYPAESQDWIYYKEAMLSKNKWKKAFNEELFNSFFSASMFNKEAKRLGLSVKKNLVSDQCQIYPNIDLFKSCIKGWLGWFAPDLPIAEYEEYTNVVVEKGASQFFYDSLGNVYIPYKSIVVILEKK